MSLSPLLTCLTRADRGGLFAERATLLAALKKNIDEQSLFLPLQGCVVFALAHSQQFFGFGWYVAHFGLWTLADD